MYLHIDREGIKQKHTMHSRESNFEHIAYHKEK